METPEKYHYMKPGATYTDDPAKVGKPVEPDPDPFPPTEPLAPNAQRPDAVETIRVHVEATAYGSLVRLTRFEAGRGCTFESTRPLRGKATVEAAFDGATAYLYVIRPNDAQSGG